MCIIAHLPEKVNYPQFFLVQLFGRSTGHTEGNEGVNALIHRPAESEVEGNGLDTYGTGGILRKLMEKRRCCRFGSK
jgi:hypothetical protein